MGIVGGFQILKSRNYIVRTFITPIYLNLELMIAYTQLYRKYLLSLRSSSLYGAFQKPSYLVYLVETALTVC